MQLHAVDGRAIPAALPSPARAAVPDRANAALPKLVRFRRPVETGVLLLRPDR
jgi:hypothetical protein